MILFIGDIHAKKDNLDKQEALFQLIEKRPEGHIFLTGDLLDNKAIVRSECMNFLYDKFRTSSKTFHIVVGNHDQHNLNTLEHSLEPFKALSNVKVYDKPTEFMIGGLLFVAVPYMHEEAPFKEALKKIDKKEFKTLVCHQGLTGFDYGNGYIAKDETNPKSIKGFKKVIIGHFHKYSEFPNGCYIGTPFSQSFGESNQTKYIGSMDEEGEFSLIETDFPRHRTYEIDCDSEDVQTELRDEDYNRLILSGTKESIDDFIKSQDFPKNVKILKKPAIEKFNSNVEISENLSNVKKFEMWASEVGEFDEDLIKLGIEVLRSVSC